MKLNLSPASVEILMMAISQLKNDSGRWMNLQPKHVLRPWVLKQLPNFEQEINDALKDEK
jgi:hypothetical protein